jgi:aspartate kinase
MSGVTDSLIKMAKEFAEKPSERELDALLATGEPQSIALVSLPEGNPMRLPAGWAGKWG